MLKQSALIAALLVFIIVTSGCVNIDPEAIAMSHPVIKQFMEEHPNANLKVNHYTESEVSDIIEIIRDECQKEEIEPKEFYLVNITDEGFNAIAWIDGGEQVVECAFKKIYQSIKCETYYEYKCYDGHLYWFDSCGNAGELKEDCDYGCFNDVCLEKQVDECTSHVKYSCYDNDIYWFDSCEEPEEKKQDCEYGCENSLCKNNDCEDSDNGKNYYIKGGVLFEEQMKYDYCIDNGLLVEIYCSDSGELASETHECLNECLEDVCVKEDSECTNNNKKCDTENPNAVLICEYNFDTLKTEWNFKEECNEICENGICANAFCFQDDYKCSNNGEDLLKCDNNQWVISAECDYGCMNDRYCAQCDEGDTKCSGNDIEVCEDGFWIINTCNNGCSDGTCIPCTENSYFQCYNNNVYWYDSCNNRMEIKETCSNGCEIDACIVIDDPCDEKDHYQCDEGHIFWYDSCDEGGDLKFYCAYGCENGNCKPSPCSSHAYSDCFEDGIFWYDSCGKMEERISDCRFGCDGNVCRDIDICYNDEDCADDYPYNEDVCSGAGGAYSVCRYYHPEWEPNYYYYCWEYNCSSQIPYPKMTVLEIPDTAYPNHKINGKGNLNIIVIFLYGYDPLPEDKIDILKSDATDLRSFKYAAKWFEDEADSYGIGLNLNIQFSDEQYKVTEEYVIHNYEESFSKDLYQFIADNYPQYLVYDLIVPFYYNSIDFSYAPHDAGSNVFKLFSKQYSEGNFNPSFNEGTTSYSKTFAHELAHKFGTYDKYTCLDTSSPRCDYAKENGVGCIIESDIPEELGRDIMCHRVAYKIGDDWSFNVPLLNELVIIEASAKEMGWLDLDSDGIKEIDDPCPLIYDNSC